MKNTKNIIIEAITKVILGFVLVGALIFIPAGNIMFKNFMLKLRESFMAVFPITLMIFALILFFSSCFYYIKAKRKFQ